jgi:RNA polymerase sigma-70 factor (ECF subfamily)
VTVRELDRRRLGDHIDRLYRAAWALCGSREEAEDLVQETFARVIARPRLLRNEDDLGYLLRALRNTFLTGRRTAGRRPVSEPLDLRLDLIEDNGARMPEAAVMARDLYAAIAELPPKCRDALVAVDVLGLSYREAGRALRVRTETITSRLYRARMLVAAQLEETGQALARDQVDQRAAVQAAR